MKKNNGAVGTLICIVIIILLIFALGGMYYYYNYLKRNDNDKISSAEKNILSAIDNLKGNISSDNNEEEKEVINTSQVIANSDFDLIKNAITDISKNDITSIVKSDNSIKNIYVNTIMIYTNEYAEVAKITIPNELKGDYNKVIGYCEYTIEFEDVTNLELDGTTGRVSGLVGNFLVDGSLFIYDRTTGLINLCSEF